MTDAERTQFIARTPPPVVAPRRDDYVPPPVDDSRRTGLIWAAVVVALLLVIGIGAFAIFKSGDGGSDQVAIPNVVGMTQAEATQALDGKGFQTALGTATSGPCTGGKTVQPNQVCTMTPAPPMTLAKGQTVTIALYKKAAPKQVQVPGVVGQQRSAALAQLKSAGVNPSNITFRPVNQLDMNGNAVANEVIAQSPQPYQYILATTGKVILNVATGKIVLPSVAGMSLDDARRAIAAAGFTSTPSLGTPVKTTDQSKDGKVADINPPVKLAYAPNTAITLTVYTYVAPTPSCTPTPTPPSSPVTTSPVPGPPSVPGAPPSTSPGTGTSTTC